MMDGSKRNMAYLSFHRRALSKSNLRNGSLQLVQRITSALGVSHRELHKKDGGVKAPLEREPVVASLSSVRDEMCKDLSFLPPYLGSLDDGMAAIVCTLLTKRGNVVVSTNDRFSQTFFTEEDYRTKIVEHGMSPPYVFAR